MTSPRGEDPAPGRPAARRPRPWRGELAGDLARCILLLALPAGCGSSIVDDRPRDYTLTTSSSPAGWGTTFGGGVFPRGTFVTVTAAPAAGFSFTSWREGDVEVSTTPAYAFALLNDRSLMATFSPVTRSVADRLDEIAGPQIHVLYVLSRDGTDRALDTNGTLARSIARRLARRRREHPLDRVAARPAPDDRSERAGHQKKSFRRMM